jgi:hypothetical protein
MQQRSSCFPALEVRPIFLAAIFPVRKLGASSKNIFARFRILQCRRADINPHFDSVNIADIP